MQTLDETMVVIHQRPQFKASGNAWRCKRQLRLSVEKLTRGPMLNLRYWWEPEDQDEFFPTGTGLTFPKAHAVHLLAALAHLCPEAVEEWLAGGGMDLPPAALDLPPGASDPLSS